MFSPSKYFNLGHFPPPFASEFLSFFFMAGCVYATAVLYWYKHPPHSNWINVRATAGSPFLPVTSYPCCKCACSLMTSNIYRGRTWKLSSCLHSRKRPGWGRSFHSSAHPQALIASIIGVFMGRISGVNKQRLLRERGAQERCGRREAPEFAGGAW